MPTLDFPARTVIPEAQRLELLLTATTPLSHHDPAEGGEGNQMLFNRQKQVRHGAVSAALPDQAQVDQFCDRLRVPAGVAALLTGGETTFGEFAAIAVVKTWLDLYNRGEGSGIFTGKERYERLESRLRQAAVQSATLRAFWDRLCRDLQAPIHAGEHDLQVLRVLTVPAAVQQLALRALADQFRTVASLARCWHAEQKRMDPEYCRRAGAAVNPDPLVALAFAADRLAPGSDRAQVLEVPAVSGNSLRHQVVRYPGWLHLCRHLGIQPDEPGQGPVPEGVEALFWNGGNIAAGAKQPSNPFALAAQVRERFPLADLLGGVTDSFDLGESRLKVGGWLVCRENRAALGDAADLPNATLSAFDLLDDVTLTRQATERGVGQMLFSFQTLCAGSQVLVRLTLTPGTRELTAGALAAALGEYLRDVPFAGGQGARGFGHMRGEILAGGMSWDWDGRRQAYEAYLREHAETLREDLASGKLGASAVVCK